MLNVGLTGGIACGKSTVARMLAEKGAVLIDFDELAHSVQEPEGPVWREIVHHFGEEILHPYINRSSGQRTGETREGWSFFAPRFTPHALHFSGSA